MFFQLALLFFTMSSRTGPPIERVTYPAGLKVTFGKYHERGRSSLMSRSMPGMVVLKLRPSPMTFTNTRLPFSTGSSTTLFTEIKRVLMRASLLSWLSKVK